MGRWIRIRTHRQDTEILNAVSIFIIAEAGVNHNGDFKTAVKLCDAAKAAHADAVKFQCFTSRSLWGDDRIEHLELSAAEFLNLSWHCRDIGIEFMATPFDPEWMKFLCDIGVKRMKVASGCISRRDILQAIPETMPVILSTGMSTWTEIGEAVRALYPRSLTLLQCTSSYPCAPQDVHLRSMDSLRQYWHSVGFSDHTENGVAAIAAAALGATVIEKHLTLDRSQEGPDHKASVEPTTFGLIVQSIRQVETMMGDSVKAVRKCEGQLRKAWRDRV